MLYSKKEMFIGSIFLFSSLFSHAQNTPEREFKKNENSITISKSKIELLPGQKSEFITVYNRSENEAFGFTIEAAKWSQKNGVDTLERSSNVLLAPKTFVIEPKQYKNIRLFASDYELAKKDYSYRLILNQISRELKNNDDTNNSKLKINIKMTIPIFFMSDLFKEHNLLDISTNLDTSKKELHIKNNSSQYIFLKNALIDEQTYKYNWYLLPQNNTTLQIQKLNNSANHKIELVTDRMTLKNK